LILLVISLVYHSSLGLQVVIEDYIHGAAKVAVLVVVQFGHVVLAVAGIYAVVVVSIGAVR
jgi:succinate dehydrogenase / fumarate reductase membrane anchor subunit